MTATIYGIKNCDTMKKAFVFLKHKGVDYVFHDYKVSGISESLLNQWCDVLGFDNVLNKAGTTFKKLDEAVYKSPLRTAGLLTVDSRVRERRMVGTGGKARRQKQSPKR